MYNHSLSEYWTTAEDMQPNLPSFLVGCPLGHKTKKKLVENQSYF